MVITGFIYPIAGSWIWNEGGWLNKLGFIDFAGSTVVHSVGAWCALAGAIAVGPREGRFNRRTGQTHEIRGHNLTLVALGGFILWFGWFGFNGGSTLAASADIGLINLNTQLAAAAGAVGAVLLSALQGKRVLIADTINGSLAGLVAITAGCASMAPGFAILTGLVGGMIAFMGIRALLALRIDDVVGAVSVHGFAGAWGTIAAGLFFKDDPFNAAIVGIQIAGVLACAVWAFTTAIAMYGILYHTIGLRASFIKQQRGLDLSEHADIAYPEFNHETAYRAEAVSKITQESTAQGGRPAEA